MIVNIDAVTGLTWTAGTLDEAQALEAERARMVCSKFQAKAALHNAGLLASANEAVSGADVLTQIAWADAIEFRRSSPAINAIGAAIGLSGQQIDDLFRAAMLIEA